MAETKGKILFLGKLPPPYIGPAVASQAILNSRLKDYFALIHLDLSDHRDINTLGKFDVTNFYLAFRHYFRLVRLIIVHRPGLVYIPAGQTTVGYLRDSVFILIAKLFRRKVVCHLRGGNFKNWYDGASRLMKWWVRFVHRRVDGQIVLGQNLRGLFDWLLPAEKIFVVPNGGNYVFPVETKTDRPVRVLFLGNFISSKGLIEVLKAAVILGEKAGEIRFLFAGSWRDPETRQEFEAILAANRHLQVDVLGPVVGQEKLRLLASAHIFVFPTDYPNEGHPWVIVEALAAGLPIISTARAAIPESVIAGKNGFLVEPKNPGQVAEKIDYLVSHPETRRQMGEESRKLYRENFTEEKMVERLRAAFQEILDRRGG